MPIGYKTITYPGVRPNFYLIDEYGNVLSLKSGKCMTKYIDGKGYVRVQLQSTKSNGRRIDIAIHRLICWEFNGPFIDNEHNLVNHKDGNKQNNNPENLEWCSNSENVLHAIENGLLKINRKYNYDEKSIRTACDLILFGLNNNEILVCIYGTLDIHSEEQCNFKNILAAIRAGKSYKHIFKDCVSRFDESKYVNINRDKINEIIKSTHDKKDTKRIKKLIKKYYNEGFDKYDILEKITGYRVSNSTIYTLRVYRLIVEYLNNVQRLEKPQM